MLQVERCPGSRHRIEKPPCFVGWLFDSILERTGVSVKLRGRSVGPETLGRSSAGVLSRNPPTGSETPSGVRTGFRAPYANGTPRFLCRGLLRVFSANRVSVNARAAICVSRQNYRPASGTSIVRSPIPMRQT
jgi:hypothetical protein